ncbi:MAG: cob(I)yrinic acid a,c-diamide adenosyltransferase [Candidatus Kerfeldbacteria bacterium]|nr:cob(I)yrinic acid a,c-diamide adenosyltransferase [Candidatus Kerfeldbacteria bacterium]
MKIYTKTGDKGTTGLFGGERVSKTHARIQAYGNVDELSSHIGVCVALLRETKKQELRELATNCEEVQQRLFVVSSHLATPTEEGRAHLPQLHVSWVEDLEHWIDSMEEQLPKLATFIVPGGTVSAAQLHIARTVARRAERSITEVHEHEYVDGSLIQYMNRLSDFLFVSARFANSILGHADVVWKK